MEGSGTNIISVPSTSENTFTVQIKSGSWRRAGRLRGLGARLLSLKKCYGLVASSTYSRELSIWIPTIALSQSK